MNIGQVVLEGFRSYEAKFALKTLAAKHVVLLVALH